MRRRSLRNSEAEAARGARDQAIIRVEPDDRVFRQIDRKTFTAMPPLVSPERRRVCWIRAAFQKRQDLICQVTHARNPQVEAMCRDRMHPHRRIANQSCSMADKSTRKGCCERVGMHRSDRFHSPEPAAIPAMQFLPQGIGVERQDPGSIPFAVVGGMIALAASGEYLSVPASVGFIALLGIAVLNGLVMVTYFRQLREEGMALSEAVRRGAERRLRPFLMTASIAAFGLVPLLFATGPGSEIQKPLAIVVIGGLVSATLLTLILLPILYERFGENAAERAAGDALHPVED